VSAARAAQAGGRDLFREIRAACARVTERARLVRIDRDRLAGLAAELGAGAGSEADADPARRGLGSPEVTLAYVVTLGAVNFGSGWFPLLHKRPGLSGYLTLAGRLEERFRAEGAWSAAELEALTPEACADVFDQRAAPAEVGELMALFARSLRDLGAWLARRFAGRFAGPVEAAAGSAERLVELLAEMPLYRDVARYGDLEVPFYKRAQLTAADLAGAFAATGWGHFRDLDRLTLFADNLVPHVLRREGVLVYAPLLAARIDRGELIGAGSPEEVEIRASALHAVEGCVAEIRRAGGRASARELDFRLWSRGQRPEYKAHPRHRTRTTAY
jgi:hypothetical protein